MTQIDWSKAPEGASHSNREGTAFHYFGDGFHLHWIAGAWVIHGRRFEEYATPGELVARPIHWTGEGQPPVGTVCEMRRTDYVDVDWQKIEFLCAGDKKAFFRDRDGYEWSRPLVDLKFRPIRTPEQIAAEEREKAIDAMLDLFEAAACKQVYDMRGGIAAIYDADYRKQPTDQ